MDGWRFGAWLPSTEASLYGPESEILGKQKGGKAPIPAIQEAAGWEDLWVPGEPGKRSTPRLTFSGREMVSR